MDLDKITSYNMLALFEYEKLSRNIDSINDPEILKLFPKSYIKLYLKQKEVLSKL